MPYYRAAGSIPPKRHTQHRTPDGRLYYEELMGEEGFSSDSSLLYHVNIPSAVVDVRAVGAARPEPHAEPPARARGTSRPRALRRRRLTGVDAVTGRRLLLGNGDVRLSYVVADAPSPLYRNAIGDECLYVESGTAIVETAVRRPRGRRGRLRHHPARRRPTGWCRRAGRRCGSTRSRPTRTSAPPKRFLSRYGQLLEHAPYCERDLRGPSAPTVVEGKDVEVLHQAPRTWAGDRRHGPRLPAPPVRRGRLGRLPLPLRVQHLRLRADHRTRAPAAAGAPGVRGHNFVICNFVPRKVDYHPLAVPVPYYHSNVDSDEVMFYCGGDYEARKGSGISAGLDLAAPGRPPARAAARRDTSGQHRRGVLRRARGHGRHLPPARPR